MKFILNAGSICVLKASIMCSFFRALCNRRCCHSLTENTALGPYWTNLCTAIKLISRVCVIFAGWSAADGVTVWWLPSADRRLLSGGGRCYNSETPCEPAIDQIVTPCSARLSHHQAQDIIGLTHTNRVTRTQGFDSRGLMSADKCQQMCTHKYCMCTDLSRRANVCNAGWQWSHMFVETTLSTHTHIQVCSNCQWPCGAFGCSAE